MSEERAAGYTPISDILSSSMWQVTATGDVRYFIEEEFRGRLGSEVYVSPVGAGILRAHPNRLDVVGYPTEKLEGEEYPGNCGVKVYKQPFVRFLPLGSIAIKRLDSLLEHDVRGIDQFRIMRLLQERDVLCATPLIASENTLVSTWVIGGIPDYLEMKEFFGFLERVWGEVKNEAEEIDELWGIDHNPESYRINIRKARNPGEKYIAIDPVMNKLNLLS